MNNEKLHAFPCTGQEGVVSIIGIMYKVIARNQSQSNQHSIAPAILPTQL